MVCLSVSRKDGRQSMVKIVLDNLRPKPRRKKRQKWERLSWKTDDERFTMFATLSGCRTERACEFCRMSPTCGALQQNLFQGSQRSGSRVARCSAVFGFYEYDSHPPHSRFIGPRPPVMPFYSRRWNWSSRGDVFTALKRSRPYLREW